MPLSLIYVFMVLSASTCHPLPLLFSLICSANLSSSYNMVVLLMASFSLCNISLTCAFAYVRNEPQIYASFSMSASDCALV